jgi:hypothetical protein
MHTDIRALLPRLSASQAHVLGDMAFAMVMVDGCGMTRMCSDMSERTGQPMKTLRQPYREMDDENEAKAGVKKRGRRRRELVGEEHVADV